MISGGALPSGWEAFRGPPALVVEVLSPSTRAFDADRKRVDDGRAGVDELWLIDATVPAAQVYRVQRAKDGELVLMAEVGAGEDLTSPLLPGFALQVGALVRR